MKNQYSYYIVFVVLVVTNLISCTDKGNNIKFESVDINEKIYLFPTNDTTLPYANVEIDFTYPHKFRSKEDLSRLQQIFIGTFFNNEAYDKMSPDKAIELFIEDYTHDYRELGNQYYDDLGNIEDDISPSWYWYKLNKKNDVLFEDENVLSYSVQHSDYTGGAHGSLSVLYYTIDLNKLTTITEESIFKPNYFKFLTSKIIERLMLKYEVDTPEELLNEGFFDINEIAPNNNFWINNEGIHYIYNQYEIAPYSMGPIEITIPYDDINPIIIPESIVSKYIE